MSNTNNVKKTDEAPKKSKLAYIKNELKADVAKVIKYVREQKEDLYFQKGVFQMSTLTFFGAMAVTLIGILVSGNLSSTPNRHAERFSDYYGDTNQFVKTIATGEMKTFSEIKKMAEDQQDPYRRECYTAVVTRLQKPFEEKGLLGVHEEARKMMGGEYAPKVEAALSVEEMAAIIEKELKNYLPKPVKGQNMTANKQPRLEAER